MSDVVVIGDGFVGGFREDVLFDVLVVLVFVVGMAVKVLLVIVVL